MVPVKIGAADPPRYFQFSGANNTTSAVASSAFFKESAYSVFQAILTGTGAITATIVIQGSMEDLTGTGTNSNWVTLGTITLNGTTVVTDGFSTAAPWRWVRANVTALTGTSAKLQVLMGS